MSELLVSPSPRTYIPGRPRSPCAPEQVGKTPVLHSDKQGPRQAPPPRPSARNRLPAPHLYPDPWPRAPGAHLRPARFQSLAALAPPPRGRAGWNHGRLADLPAGPGQSADGCDPKGNVSLTPVFTSAGRSVSSGVPRRAPPTRPLGIGSGPLSAAADEAVLRLCCPDLPGLRSFPEGQ